MFRFFGTENESCGCVRYRAIRWEARVSLARRAAGLGMSKREEQENGATYDCSKCPGYCCIVYDGIAVTDADLNRLAAHLNLSAETTPQLYTREIDGQGRALQRRPDAVFERACIFLDAEKHNCTVSDARPEICRLYQTSCTVRTTISASIRACDSTRRTPARQDYLS